MKIGFIGAGRAGTAFGVYLQKNGMSLVGYASRSEASAKKAASLTESRYFSKKCELVEACDLIFITTPDGAIEEVAWELCECRSLEKKIFVHMSGAHSSHLLKALTERGAEVGSLHPIQSLADVDTAVKQLGSTVFSIEGSEGAASELEGIMSQLDNEYFVIKSEQKTLYHMAACTVSNYLVTLVDMGLAMYESIGIDRAVGYQALYPLIRGTIENLRHMDTKEALTGPIARGDVNTVKAHLNAVPENEMDAFYRFLGLATVQLAKRKQGADQIKLGKLEELLDDEVKS